MLMVLTTLILSGFGAYEYHALRTNSLLRLNDLAENASARLIENLVEPLWGYDPRQAEKVVIAEMQEKNVLSIQVHDATNHLMIGKGRDSEWQIIAQENAAAGDIIVRERDIIRKGAKIGSVTLYVTKQFMQAELCRAIRTIIVAIGFLDATLFLTLTLSLRQMLIHPLAHLVQVASSLADGDMEVSLPAVRSRDEIGVLTSDFVRMVAYFQSMASAAEQIANGDLRYALPPRSDQDVLGKAFSDMVAHLNKILAEIGGLTQAFQAGQLSVRGEAGRFGGEYARMIAGINAILDAFSETNAVNQRLKTDNLRMTTEMELARQIQTSLLPKSLDRIHPDFEMAAVMIPAEEVGGDYYDALFDHDGNLWLGIGDVSGHGLTSGLIMMMAQTIQTAMMRACKVTPKDVVVAMNHVLYHNIHTRLETEHHMTFTALKYLGDGEFQHAGIHVDLLVYRQASQECELIDTDGVFLSLIDDIAYATENRAFHLNPGDILALYTDGIIEAANPHDKLFDISRLRDCVNAHAARPLNELRDAILRETLAWSHQHIEDDMTVVLLRRIR